MNIAYLPALLLCLLWPLSIPADVVKPALTEISVYQDGRVDIELRASIEALITGINSQYKNTQEAPQADEYDALRVLDSTQLHQAFDQFAPDMLSTIKLTTKQQTIPMLLGETHIPPAGYTQVPRISTIHLTGQLPPGTPSLQFYYPARYGDYAVRVKQVDDQAERWHWSQWEWVREDRPSQAFSLTEVFTKRSTLETIWEFIQIGFTHIAPKGTDHILFILGIFLLSRQWRPLLGQVTMFTLAHTLTLGLSSAGWFALSPQIVEPLIALSIAYIGFENIWSKQLQTRRLFLVFAFGLLHGLGFAGVLAEFKMPEDAFFTALLSFNLGVEFGQIAVLLAAMLLVGWIKPESVYRKWITIPASVLIGIIGLVWMVERLQF